MLRSLALSLLFRLRSSPPGLVGEVRWDLPFGARVFLSLISSELVAYSGV